MRYSLLILSVDWGVGVRVTTWMACLVPTLFWYVTLAAVPLGVDLCALVGALWYMVWFTGQSSSSCRGVTGHPRPGQLLSQTQVTEAYKDIV